MLAQKKVIRKEKRKFYLVCLERAGRRGKEGRRGSGQKRDKKRTPTMSRGLPTIRFIHGPAETHEAAVRVRHEGRQGRAEIGRGRAFGLRVEMAEEEQDDVLTVEGPDPGEDAKAREDGLEPETPCRRRVPRSGSAA